jgi:MFS family permease
MSTTRFEAHLELEAGRLSINAGASASAELKQVGFWSAALATVFSIGYGLAVIAMIIASASTPTAAPGWHGMEAYLASFQPIVMLPLIPSLLLAPTFVVLMVCVHAYAPNAKKLWSQVGLAFAIVYATMACVNYIVQLTVVRLSILNKETDGLAMFVSGNPHSIFWALASAYVFMNLAMLFAAPVFEGGKLERWIRWLFLANGASAVVTIFGVVVDSPMIYLLGSLVPWCVIFSAATILLAVLFKRSGQSGAA